MCFGQAPCAPADSCSLVTVRPVLAEAPTGEGGLGHLVGLFCQLWSGVRFNEEHHLGLTIRDLRGKRTLNNFIAWFINYVVAQSSWYVSSHVEPVGKLDAQTASVQEEFVLELVDKGPDSRGVRADAQLFVFRTCIPGRGRLFLLVLRHDSLCCRRHPFQPVRFLAFSLPRRRHLSCAVHALRNLGRFASMHMHLWVPAASMRRYWA